uniref:Uncharacterized protein n=1 Tax=Arundo donax TaxID=35708 RepID=A0A0A9DX18_ARUDO
MKKFFHLKHRRNMVTAVSL